MIESTLTKKKKRYILTGNFFFLNYNWKKPILCKTNNNTLLIKIKDNWVIKSKENR